MEQGVPRPAVLAAVVVAAGVFGLAGCARGPVDRRALCTEYDKLGTEIMGATGFADNAVFSSAGDLADLAGRYQGGGLSADAEALQRIADADETTSGQLEGATAGTARVCGHPLGEGTTQYVDSSHADGGSGAPATSAPPLYAPATTSTAPAAPATPADAGPSDELSAQAWLRRQADDDRKQAEAVQDRWVPQLSSKNLGLVADGITYDYRAIWADFTTTRQAEPSALLLWSGAYASFTKGDFWVTVANTSFASGAEANEWCVTRNLDADHCFAKLVSHSHGPKGSTLPR